MTKTLILFCLLGANSYGKDRIVAILDTGLDINDSRFQKHLCPGGHRDFTGEGLQDKLGHGTHVLGLIQKYAPETGWCAVVIKVFTSYTNNQNKLSAYDEAFKYLLLLKPDYVNLSANGKAKNPVDEQVIKILTKTKFILAVGNDSMDLSKPDSGGYPAKYWSPNITPVGSVDSMGTRSKFSNYGLAYIRTEQGEDVVSEYPCPKKDHSYDCYAVASGTSQSTAIATGKIVKEDIDKERKNR